MFDGILELIFCWSLNVNKIFDWSNGRSMKLTEKCSKVVEKYMKVVEKCMKGKKSTKWQKSGQLLHKIA